MLKLQWGALCVLIATAFPGSAIAAACDGPTGSPPAITANAPLTLNMALMQIRYASPEVRRAALETQARQAEVNQAGLRPNPVIAMDVENFAGSGALSGFNQSETTFSISQTFELGGKRELRRDLAIAQAKSAQTECAALLRRAQLEGAILFYDLEASVQVERFAYENVALSETFVEIVEKRVGAGAAAPPELSRARSDLAAVKAQYQRAKAQTSKLRFQIASLWGSATPQFANPVASPVSSTESGVPEVLSSQHPLLDLAEAQTSSNFANRNLVRAQALPDVTVNAGFRRFSQSNDNALVIGLSVPLPIFDKKRDALRAAEYRQQSAILNQNYVQTELESQLNSARLQLRSAMKQLALFEAALIDARKAYDASVQGYKAGKFDLNTTLNARKAMIDAGLAVIDAERQVKTEDITLRSLIGAAPFSGDFQ